MSEKKFRPVQAVVEAFDTVTRIPATEIAIRQSAAIEMQSPHKNASRAPLNLCGDEDKYAVRDIPEAITFDDTQEGSLESIERQNRFGRAMLGLMDERSQK